MRRRLPSSGSRVTSRAHLHTACLRRGVTHVTEMPTRLFRRLYQLRLAVRWALRTRRGVVCTSTVQFLVRNRAGEAAPDSVGARLGPESNDVTPIRPNAARHAPTTGRAQMRGGCMVFRIGRHASSQVATRSTICKNVFEANMND